MMTGTMTCCSCFCRIFLYKFWKTNHIVYLYILAFFCSDIILYFFLNVFFTSNFIGFTLTIFNNFIPPSMCNDVISGLVDILNWNSWLRWWHSNNIMKLFLGKYWYQSTKNLLLKFCTQKQPILNSFPHLTIIKITLQWLLSILFSHFFSVILLP